MEMHNDRKSNIEKNDLEAREKKSIMESTPQYITLGTHSHCNAKCVFCSDGNYPKFTLDIYKNFFEKKMKPVLERAKFVGFCGWGELLLMPGIEEFIGYVDETLPDVGKVFTTNGIALTQNTCDRLLSGRHAPDADIDPFSILISLHASSPALHHSLTGTNAFDKIVSQIRYLVIKRSLRKARIHIRLIFLATSMNIADLPDFVSMAEALGVDEISCSYLTIFKPEHVRYSCYFCKEKTNEMFALARERAKKFNVKLSLPPSFERTPVRECHCQDPWNFFYVETQGSVNPCCFAGNHIGYLSEENFETIWNGDGYRKMREGLQNGTLHTWCKYCYRYDANNVNDIRSHITFRPDTQRSILDYLKENRNTYVIPEETLEL